MIRARFGEAWGTDLSGKTSLNRMTLGQRPEESDERMRVSGEAAFQVVGIVRDK